MIAWIIGIVILLVISLFITDQNVEGFEYNPPTVVPSKVRKDLTCSDPNESALYDRFDGAGMRTLAIEANHLTPIGDCCGNKIVMDTGIPFAEGKAEWHHKSGLKPHDIEALYESLL